MRLHWVSQNQTGNHEVSGGYMWCPKSNADGSRNVNYDMMRNVEPGDVVFSFRDRAITHIGIVISTAYEARKPAAFGARGTGWLDLGWMVRVEYESVRCSFIPSMHMELLRPLLPPKYSPLQQDGRGNQMYFTTLSEELGYALLGLSAMVIDQVNALVASLQPAITNAVAYAVEEAIEIELLDTQRVQASQLTTTQKNALVSARVGQGAFRDAVLRIEPCCRVLICSPKSATS